jgi:hypothetical protein
LEENIVILWHALSAVHSGQNNLWAIKKRVELTDGPTLSACDGKAGLEIQATKHYVKVDVM